MNLPPADVPVMESQLNKSRKVSPHIMLNVAYTETIKETTKKIDCSISTKITLFNVHEIVLPNT